MQDVETALGDGDKKLTAKTNIAVNLIGNIL
jgi:hypothetical protein